MTDNTPAGIAVERLETGNTVKMTWRRHVKAQDVQNAFKIINEILAESDRELIVVVDLLSNPNMPLSSTINEALFGPYRNPKLREWLIIGSVPVAQLVERMLNGVTRRKNVSWFDSEADAMRYLEGQQGTTTRQ